MKKILWNAALIVSFAGVIMAGEDPFANSKARGEEKKSGELKQQKAFQHRDLSSNIIEKLKNVDPNKYEELKKLKEEDPEKFKEEIRKIAKEFMEKFRAEREEIEALAAKFKETGSEEDKNALKAKIKQQLQKRIELGKERIAETEAKLNKLKAQIEDTEKNIDAKIDERIDQILNEIEKRKQNKENKCKTEQEKSE